MALWPGVPAQPALSSLHISQFTAVATVPVVEADTVFLLLSSQSDQDLSSQQAAFHPPWLDVHSLGDFSSS